jgi:ABC-type transport system involved in multi-copper enzyme maturation permease subunit
MSDLLPINLIQADLVKFYKISWSRILICIFILFNSISILGSGSISGRFYEYIQPNFAPLLAMNFGGNLIVLALIMILYGSFLAYEWETWGSLPYILNSSKNRTQFLVARILTLLLLIFSAIFISVILISFVGLLIIIINAKTIDWPTMETFLSFGRVCLRVFILTLTGILLGLWLTVINPILGKFGFVYLFLEITLLEFLPENIRDNLEKFMLTPVLNRIYQFSEAEINSNLHFDISNTDYRQTIIILLIYGVLFFYTLIWRFKKQDIR